MLLLDGLVRSSPLERSQVRGEADVDLLDGEDGVLRGVADVASGDDVDASAVAASVDRRDDGDWRGERGSR